MFSADVLPVVRRWLAEKWTRSFPGRFCRLPSDSTRGGEFIGAGAEYPSAAAFPKVGAAQAPRGPQPRSSCRSPPGRNSGGGAGGPVPAVSGAARVDPRLVDCLPVPRQPPAWQRAHSKLQSAGGLAPVVREMMLAEEAAGALRELPLRAGNGGRPLCGFPCRRLPKTARHNTDMPAAGIP